MDQAFEGIVASYQHRPLNVDDAELRRMIDDENLAHRTRGEGQGVRGRGARRAEAGRRECTPGQGAESLSQHA